MKNSDFELVRSAVLQLVREKLSSSDGCHDFDHTLRVWRMSCRLVEALPSADRQVIELAALLHDIARPEEMRSGGKLCHAALGAEMIPVLLKALVPPEMISRIAEAVRTHRYRDREHPASLEAEIVYDADKLDSLGAIGIGRAFLFAGKLNARCHNTESEALNAPPYSREDTAYREYLVKLRHLPDAMLTKPGRQLAAERAEFMKLFFDRLNCETSTR